MRWKIAVYTESSDGWRTEFVYASVVGGWLRVSGLIVAFGVGIVGVPLSK